jgi:tetratricopeptide (TPR) repeat protein
MKRWVLVLLMAAPLTPCWAAAGEDPQALFAQANADYRAQRLEAAVMGYQQLIRRGYRSGALYYNLGNAWLKQGKQPRALAAYLEARRYAPRDPDIKANLKHVLRELGVADVERPPAWLHGLMLGRAFSTEELARWVLGCSASTALLVCLAWFAPGGAPVWRRCAVLGALLTAVFGTALTLQTRAEQWPRAVVLAEAPVYYAPAATEQRFSLPEGAAVELLQVQAPWAQIKAPAGVGWIAEEHLFSFQQM